MFSVETIRAQSLASENYSQSSYLINDAGVLYTWGNNNHGQLGVADTSLASRDTLSMVAFPAGVTGWSSLTGGIAQTLAIGDDGNLYVWGNSGGGRLGIGAADTADVLEPLKVDLPFGLTGWKMAAAGAYHSLAIGSDGNLYTCGNGGQGQLGLGDFNGRNTFTKVTPPTGVTGWVNVAAGQAHSMAIGDDGNLYTFGSNGAGRLGIGSTTKENTPQLVPLPDGVTQWTEIAAEAFASLALGNDGNLYAFGHNGQGELGVNSTANQLSPTQVVKPSGVTKWTAVAGGAFHALAIGDDGNLYAWGMNSTGQLGIGTTENDSIPVMVPMPEGVTGWTAIAAGNGHSLAIGDDGNLYTWGLNDFGELGTGDITEYDSPTKITSVMSTAIAPDRSGLPSAYKLNQNYPNPFNPTTQITYQLKKAVTVHLSVYDITGRRVATLVDQRQSAGPHMVTFNAMHLASGIYFYRLQAGNFSNTRKMILLK